ncbi:MAG: hypothetical protein RBU21_16900 [FCB group bacterium]|nr:hypothetical protein [FCB group bacterium]
MIFLQNAIAAVQRNALALLIYAAGILGIQILGLAAEYVFLGGWTVPAETMSGRMQAIGLAISLVQAPLSAIVTAIAFARIGKDMDRPLWRSAGDRDALRRFFQLWFVLILVSLALGHATSVAHSRESSLVVPLLLLYLLFSILTVPIGACMMFPGAPQWREIGRNLAPLGYQFPRTLLLCFLTFLQVVLVQKVFEVRVDPEAGYRWLLLTPVVTVIGAYIDCLVFAGAWLMCIDHRNTDRDTDFDF